MLPSFSRLRPAFLLPGSGGGGRAGFSSGGPGGRQGGGGGDGRGPVLIALGGIIIDHLTNRPSLNAEEGTLIGGR